MSRFNEKTTKATPNTVNKAGGEAYAESPRLELVSILLTSFVKDQFYRSADDTMSDVARLITKMGGDEKFAAKAAIYARNQFGMRSITHVTASEIAHVVKGQPWTKDFLRAVVRRPDDVTEILAYYMSKYGKPIPNSMKKGLGAALTSFDEYQIAKYKGNGKSVSLVDAVNLCHPKYTDALTKLVYGKLTPANTWETKLTKAGQGENKDEDKAEAWSELLRNNKLGYFALLRNLRNICEQADGETISIAAQRLVDEKAIKKSLVMPFRFLTAAKNIPTAPRNIRNAVTDAMEISLSNVPELPGRTLVALDDSGSMRGQPHEIGSIFASVLFKTNDADLIMFSDDARWFTDKVNPRDSVVTIAHTLIKYAKMYGTNFNSIFDAANREGKVYDRIIILSDMQAWMKDGWYSSVPTKSFAAYKKATGANPHIYSFDLCGEGSLQFPENKVYAIAGFSEKVFDIMAMLEQDKQALIHEIEKVEI